MKYMLMRKADVDTGNSVPSPALEKHHSQQKLPREMGADMAGDCYQAPQGTQVHLEYDNAGQTERVFRRCPKEAR